jgi:hypothetical protein
LTDCGRQTNNSPKIKKSHVAAHFKDNRMKDNCIVNGDGDGA